VLHSLLLVPTFLNFTCRELQRTEWWELCEVLHVHHIRRYLKREVLGGAYCPEDLLELDTWGSDFDVMKGGDGIRILLEEEGESVEVRTLPWQKSRLSNMRCIPKSSLCRFHYLLIILVRRSICWVCSLKVASYLNQSINQSMYPSVAI